MDIINNFLWSIATIMLVLSGLYFAFKLNFLHLNVKKNWKSLKPDKSSNSGMSSFETLTVSLGGCIGVGSLAGIALAIFKGGIGTIFWIWLSCLLVAPNSLVENALALIYQKKVGSSYVGGPAYYIKYGLGYKKLAFIYAALITFAYLFGFLTIQANTIVKSFTNFFSVPSIVIGLVIGLFSFIVIRKGMKGIAKFSSFFVPLMGLLYLLVSLFIVFKNISLLPNLFLNIFREAFSFKASFYGFLSVMLIGIQRGIFSSEAGIGASAIASGSSTLKDPIKQGLIQTFGVYFTTFVICTSTAFIILTSNYNPLDYTMVNGIEITQNALIYHLGSFGNIILYFCIIAFSFSTIVSGYYYAECNLQFIFKKLSQKALFFLKIFTCFLLILGSILSSNFLWNLVDVLVAILAIINIFSLVKLKKDIIIEYNNYKRMDNHDRKRLGYSIRK